MEQTKKQARARRSFTDEVAPDIDLGGAFQQRFAVELRRPDGSRLRADALAQVPSIVPITPGAARPHHMLEFAKLTRADVPIGTEVWTTGES
jgi:hypothetical protein